MFTPQRKGWAGSAWQENGSVSRTNPRGSILGRGKDLVKDEETPAPPPQDFLGVKDGDRQGSSGDWKRFREAGLLDEKVQLRKDKEMLVDRVSTLEVERDECLYNMGLLLIEKNEWSSQMEELRQALMETQEIVKREQSSHIIAVSELEKREENLKQAFGIEKQCVADLEKALREMRSEASETKFLSENKLSNAHALEARLEEKQLEIEAKLRSADARLAEANRKNSEMDRKLNDIEAREHRLQRELSSLHNEQKAHDNDLLKQREHLLDWEKELQEKQRRLLDEQRLLNEREEMANNLDSFLKKKEAEIEELRKKIDANSSALKIHEDDYKTRLKALALKEKSAEIKSSNLEAKEKDLSAVEENLIAREREEIQKLLDEHSTILDAKQQDFELEMEKKRRSFDEEAKNNADILIKKQNTVRIKEEKLLEREKELVIESDSLAAREKELNLRSVSLNKLEESLKTEEKSLQEKRKKMVKDSDEIEASRAKLRDEKAAVEEERAKVVAEKESLQLTKEEKEHHAKLQEELKREKDEWRVMMDSLVKQKEALMQEREKFEREWEELDEKIEAFKTDEKQFSLERKKLEKWRHSEEERLKQKGFEDRSALQRELDDLKLKKEYFEKKMEHELAAARSEAEKERADMSREFELLKHELEMNVQRTQDESEKQFREKKSELERWRETEQNTIKSSGETNDFERKSLETQRIQLQREKDEFFDQRRKLEADRLEVQKDIDTLLRLSKNLKGQREEFAKEREMLFSAAEQCKNCNNCGAQINNFNVSNLQTKKEAEDSGDLPLLSLTDNFLEDDTKGGSPLGGSTDSGSNMKRWFRRCANLFKASPGGHLIEQAQLDSEDDAETSVGGANSFMDASRIESDDGGTKEPVKVPADEDNAAEEFIALPSKRGRRRGPKPGAKSKPIRRTHSVMEVVKDAKAILGEDFDLKAGGQEIGAAEEIPTKVNPVEAGKRKKRRTREVDPEASEPLSESISVGGHRKRRQISSQQAPDKRYNLRRSTVAASSHGASNQIEAAKSENAEQESEIAVGGESASNKAENVQPKDDIQSSVKVLNENAKLAAHVDESLEGGNGVGAISRPAESEEQFQFNESKEDGDSGERNIDDGDERNGKNVEIAKSTEMSERFSDEAGEEVDGDERGGSASELASGSEEDDDEEEEDDDKRNASLGKKLWTFLTT